MSARAKGASEPRRGLGRDVRGAVYVEFLIAFLPLFVLFMSLVQLAFVQVAALVNRHAAVVAVRAAIVVLPDDDRFYSDGSRYNASGSRLTAIQNAAKQVLSAVAASPNLEIKFPTSAGGDDNQTQFAHDDMVRVRTKFLYDCRIPIGNTFVCGLAGGPKLLEAEAAMPIAGATYDY